MGREGGPFRIPLTIKLYYIMSTKIKATPKWEIKDRTYVLGGGRSPLTYFIKSKGFLWFDEDQGINREIRFASNQRSLFVDEQDDNVRLEQVVFRDGVLFVPRSKPLLQQLLEIYHPQRNKWSLVDKEAKAADYVDTLEVELDAMMLVNEAEIEHLEAVMRTELGSSVSSMSSKELKRDAYAFAKRSPKLFTDLYNDEDIKLRNLANRAVELGIIKLTDNNTTFKHANGKKIITVPFDEHPFIALAQYFKTDEGVDLMKSITKKLS